VTSSTDHIDQAATDPAKGSPTRAPRPLAGLRVVDSASERGELCGRLLADLGADVIRVEPPGGDPSRRLGPGRNGVSYFFALRNLGKRSWCLDPSVPGSLDAFHHLLEEADFWIESSRPNRAAPGLDPLAASRAHPGLIVTSITDFGHTGPYRDYAGSDPVLVALSGMLFKAGVAAYPPVLPPGYSAYDIAGVTAAFATLTAYWQKRWTGRGQHLDLSVMEACAQTTDWGLAGLGMFKQLLERDPASEVRNGAGSSYNIYPCRDGYVRVSVVTRREWHKIREWLGEPEILQDPHWDTSGARAEIRDVIEPMYEGLFADQTMMDLSVEGQKRGLGVTPLLTPSDVLSLEHFQALESFVEAEVAPGLSARVADGFYRFDGVRIGRRGPAPAVPQPGAPPPAWEVPAGVKPYGTDSPSSSGPDGASEPVAEAGERPFVGIRVLDFGVAGAAPEIGRLLAEYGADVIRVESPGRPDLFRTLLGTGDMTALFASSSRTKRSFGVNFKDAEGIQAVKTLIATADVLVENLPPGTMEGMGLSWAEVQAVNPRLVMLSTQLMGRRGPWMAWRGYGANTQPVAGLTHLWSYPDTEPLGANVAFPDHVVGRLATTAVIAALVQRRHTGRGVHIDVAQVEAVLNLLGDLYLGEALEPGSLGPVGNHSDRDAPWGVFQCQGLERWCVVTVRDDQDWSGLVAALGHPAWARDERFSTSTGRVAAAGELNGRLAEWAAGRSDREAMETLQAHGVPAGLMMYISREPDDPHLRARGYIREIVQDPIGPILLEGPAFYGSGMPDTRIEPAPHLGEHTRVLAAELGLDPDEVARLESTGALFQYQAPEPEGAGTG